MQINPLKLLGALIGVFALGFVTAKMSGPAKVVTTLVSASSTAASSDASKAKNEKAKGSVKTKRELVTAPDGSSKLTEEIVENTESEKSEDEKIQEHFLAQHSLRQEQTTMTNMRNIFAGVGISTKKKWKGILGGNAGIPGAAVTSDGENDHAVFGTLNFQF